MENLVSKDILDYEDIPGKGFSKKQINKFTAEDIEDLYLLESSDGSSDGVAAEKKPNEEYPEKSKQEDPDPNDGGPRPPKEEEYPDETDEEDDPLSETSDPNKED